MCSRTITESLALPMDGNKFFFYFYNLKLMDHNFLNGQNFLEHFAGLINGKNCDQNSKPSITLVPNVKNMFLSECLAVGDSDKKLEGC